MNLTDVIGLEMLQKIQDAFSSAFDVPAIIYDKKGVPITQPSNFTNFCQLIRSSPKGKLRCEQFDAQLMLDLSKNRRPIVRKGCTVEGIITGSAPIVIGGSHLANIGIGQMIDKDFNISHVQTIAEEIEVPPLELTYAAASLIPFEKEKFDKMLAFLNTLAEQLGLLGLQNLQQARFIHEREQLNRQLGQMHKMESLGVLAGGIAHDFNNILFPIMGYAEMLLDDAPEGSLTRKNLEKILSATNRARDLIKQILAFSRQGEAEKQPVRIQIILKEALKLIRSTLPTTIEIKQNIDPSCKPVMADPTHIHQVIMNLITNAFQAMQEGGGVLEVRLESVQGLLSNIADPGPTKGPFVCMTVADTGPGIPDNLLEKIFDPYFSTKEKDKGTGLGLSVVHGIVKDCGGDVKVTNAPGAGAEFKVFLPVMESETRPEKITRIASVAGGSEHLLVVDDEPVVAQMEKDMLERMGYRVTSMTDSKIALKIFQETPDNFDLVLTDMTMPGLTGVQLARELKAIRPDIRIVLCTGFSQIMDEEKAAKLDIQGFIMKPVVAGELGAKIREALDSSL